MPVITGALLAPEQQQSYVKLLEDREYSEEATRFLAEALGLQDFKHDVRVSVQLDYAAWMCMLCNKLQLDGKQTSAVIQIGQQLLEGCSAGVPRTQAQDLLRSLLLQLCSPTHAVPSSDCTQESPECGAVPNVQLSAEVVASLAASFTSTLLQHYNLWAYVFTHEQQHVQHQHHLTVVTPVPPPPLQQALLESDWQAHLAAEQAQQEAQAAAAEAADRAAQEAQAAADAAAAEAAEAAARAEQLQRKPKTLDEAVDKLVSLKLEDVREGLTAEYAAKASALAARLEHLEQRLQQQAAQAAAAPPASASSHGGKGAAVSSRVTSAGSRVASAKPGA